MINFWDEIKFTIKNGLDRLMWFFQKRVDFSVWLVEGLVFGFIAFVIVFSFIAFGIWLFG